MSRLTVGQKANRVLRLLMGLRNPTVAAALQEHGFTDQELEEGWRRLSGLTRQRLGLRLAVENPTKVQELDDFENRWFPVARLTLKRHFPALAQELFLNLSQTDGIEVVFSVSTFLERLESMAEGNLPLSDGPAALALLETRGLTAERIQRAKTVLAELGTFSRAQASAPPIAEDQQAEDALWSWYLEWGGIARLVVTDRRSLRAMGFLARRKSGDALDELEEDDGEDDVGGAEGAGTNAATATNGSVSDG